MLVDEKVGVEKIQSGSQLIIHCTKMAFLALYSLLLVYSLHLCFVMSIVKTHIIKLQWEKTYMTYMAQMFEPDYMSIYEVKTLG